MKIIIDDKIPFINGAFTGMADVVYLPGKEIGPEHVKDADALIIRTRTNCNRDLLEGSKVRFIATATIGYDHIDTEYCKEKGIEWTNAPGCNSSSVEQYIVSVLLYLASTLKFKLEQQTIGIIGVGNVGKKVRRVSEALGLKVLCNDPPRERMEGGEGFTDLTSMLNRANIVTMHVPLSREGEDKTYEMADESFFSTMKKGAIFINSSRGEVVNENALKEVLRKGEIETAVLDVFQNEPDIDPDLLSGIMLATPHIAGYSVDGKVNGTVMSVLAVSKFFNLDTETWKPANVPSPENPVLYADASENDTLSFLADIYKQCYEVSVDDEMLREAPGTFEHLRGSNRARREASVYSVRLYNDDGKYRKILEELGFSVIGDSCF